MKAVTLGTRGSPLALAQTEIVRALLRKAHPSLQFEMKIIKTSGDQFHNLSLTAGGGKELFTKGNEDQHLRGGIYNAGHSMKDLPTTFPDRVPNCAGPGPAEARGAVCSERLA